MHTPPKRVLYLLTLWQERPVSPDRPAIWRLSLEDVHTSARYAFGDCRALVAFLHTQMEGLDEADELDR